MQDYQNDFIQFALDTGVLRFGAFTLKSGRQSPYFFNSGLFNTGATLARLGRFYAQAIEAADVGYDTLFGPAYKGIPLVSAISIALADHHDRDVPWVFNRKEAKDHGEGGVTVGAALKGRVLIVDDVISAGTSVRESMVLIEQAGASAAGVAIALDRQERGQGETSAIQEIERDYGIPVVSIIKLEHLLAFLENDSTLAEHAAAVAAYRQQYGVA